MRGGCATKWTREVGELGLGVYGTVLFSKMGFLRGSPVKISIWVFAKAKSSIKKPI
jgi:hypothetical protein